MFDLWLNGKEAVDSGYADEVVTVKCDASLNGTRSVVEDYGFVRLNLEFSQCPVKTYPTKVEVELATTLGFMKMEEFIQKNGQFGESCFTKTTQNRDNTASYSGNSSNNYFYSPLGGSSLFDNDQNVEEQERQAPKKAEKLCVQDKSITLESIMKKKEERVRWHTRDLKDHIAHSY